MRVTFHIRAGSVEANVSPASVRMMDGLDPVARADLWRDIAYDAEQQYKRSLEELRAVRIAAGAYAGD